MANQLTSNAEALRLFFTEDIYLVSKASEIMPALEVLSSKTDEVEHEVFTSKKPNTDFKYLGKNQKKILILVNDNQHDVSTERGRELLRKLVKAINLTANDFALVNYAGYTSEKFEDLEGFFNCKLLLAFGVSATDLNLPVQPLHQLANFNNIQLLFTTNLDDLDGDQAGKKILWASLQQLK